MFFTTFCTSIATTAALLFATTAFAADPPQQKQGDWTVKDFRFHTGEVLPELKLHYVTIGEPTGEPVLVLHGSNGSGQNMLGPNFAGELFRAGPAARRRQILPHRPRRAGLGQIVEALERAAHGLPEIHL
jgi:homoserine O-acetyltransferase/O-succinyltransferase